MSSVCLSVPYGLQLETKNQNWHRRSQDMSKWNAKPPQQAGVVFTYTAGHQARAAPALTAGWGGLEFTSVAQPVAIGRTAAYHVGADVFVFYTVVIHNKFKPRCCNI